MGSTAPAPQGPNQLVQRRVYLVLHHILKELSSKRLAADQRNFEQAGSCMGLCICAQPGPRPLVSASLHCRQWRGCCVHLPGLATLLSWRTAVTPVAAGHAAAPGAHVATVGGRHCGSGC